MSPANRKRLFAVLVVMVVIPIGLFARSHRAGADSSSLPGFLATYLGDTLWPIMFYFAARFCFPNARVGFYPVVCSGTYVDAGVEPALEVAVACVSQSQTWDRICVGQQLRLERCGLLLGWLIAGDGVRLDWAQSIFAVCRLAFVSDRRLNCYR